MIQEDYVSFEVAKLLKEKGFPQEYDVYHSMVYNEEDYEDEYEVQRMVLETKLVKAGTLSSYPISVPEPKCYCCTLQMAMKWLREVHKLTFIISPQWAEGDMRNPCRWYWEVKGLKDITTDVYSNPLCDSYEEAVEAALKYSLENLI